MRVMIFAFDGSRNNPNLPENHVENAVVFTGTHEANTVRGWFVDEINNRQKKHIYEYLGKRVSEEQICSEMVKLAIGSRAKLSIIPIQDVLSLGSEARINHPSRQLNNWQWRVTSEQLASRRIEMLGKLTEDFNRE